MINTYSDFGFYGSGSQHMENQPVSPVAYRLGGLSLNTGYQNRMVQNGSSQNYADSKPYDQMSCHHPGQEGDNLVKESQNNFKTPDPIQTSTTTASGAWNGFNSMRPLTSPASSLPSIPASDFSAQRLEAAMAYRSMQMSDMYAYCQQNQVMNPGMNQAMYSWMSNSGGKHLF